MESWNGIHSKLFFLEWIDPYFFALEWGQKKFRMDFRMGPKKVVK